MRAVEKALLAEMRELRRMMAPAKKDGRAPRFRDFAQEWFARYCKSRRKPATLANRRNVLRLYLLPPLGRRRVNEVDARAVESLRKHMAALTDRTKNGALVVLTMILRDAKERGWVAELPRIALEAVVDVKPRIHDVDAYVLIVRAAKRLGWRHHLAVLLCGDAALRASEVAGLNWSCVRLEDRTLDIVAQAYRGELIAPKGNASRCVAMTDDLFEALTRAKKRRTTERVVPGATKAAIGGSSITWLVVDSMQAAGFGAKGGAHILRHTCASHALDGGATLTSIQEMLGHRHIMTTEKYLHSTPKTLQDAARLLSEIRSRRKH